MANDLFIPIASEDPRLKRRINHDSRSALYRLPTRHLSILDREWPIHLPGPLDQGELGSCVPNSGDEILASDPFFATLDTPLQQAVSAGDQKWILALYHDLTTADDYPGTYPPDDTGSDGLTLAKVLKARGDISGYQHTFTTDDALVGVSNHSPAAWGTLWMSGMDDVNESTGQVRYSGSVRGGHELSIYKIVAAKEQVWFHNHWAAWGYQGTGNAWISFDDFDKSLKDQGDVTFFTPLTKPAPVPTPVPPQPTPMDPNDAALIVKTIAWCKAKHVGTNAAAAKAVSAWAKAKGYIS